MYPTDTTTPTATIFDVQGFSLHDGPGIRTTVFFKGCPLRCVWCHNPESLSAAPQLVYHGGRCTGCMQCVAVCPTGAHGAEGGLHRVDQSLCNGCGACRKVCCYDALELLGKRYTPQALLQRVQGDFPYYTAGAEKGGITFSGGEPLLHLDFLLAFMELLPKGIHIAVETCGHVPQSVFEALRGRVDLYLFDYKATDPALHKTLCGHGNALLLQNLQTLCEGGEQVALRLPLVPGVNDDDAHLLGVRALLVRLPQIQYAEIMPYHNIGVGKRQSLGLAPQGFGETGATEEDKQRWLRMLQNPTTEIRISR